MSEVSLNFLDAFADALSVDGDAHSFVFADGVPIFLTCLWVKDVSAYMHTHTHGFNAILHENQRIVLIRESEVPASARLRANDYLTVDGVRFKIMQARLKDFIWTLQLMIISTNVN
jgi:hypothetical protein